MNDFEKSVEFVYAISVAGKSAGEIETETIDMHLKHPVAQTVHH